MMANTDANWTRPGLAFPVSAAGDRKVSIQAAWSAPPGPNSACKGDTSLVASQNAIATTIKSQILSTR